MGERKRRTTEENRNNRKGFHEGRGRGERFWKKEGGGANIFSNIMRSGKLIKTVNKGKRALRWDRNKGFGFLEVGDNGPTEQEGSGEGKKWMKKTLNRENIHPREGAPSEEYRGKSWRKRRDVFF